MLSVAADQQLIRVGHSPDPDDAFMFHALANGKIATGPYEFRHELVDIETLNRLGITHRRTAYNHPEGNSYIERFHRSLKEEEVWLNEYQNFDQARRSIAAWIEGRFESQL